MTGEKGEGEEQSQERRLENQRQLYKFPSWKSRVAPRGMSERTEVNMENIKRWKNVQARVARAGKPNQTVCNQALGSWWSTLPPKPWCQSTPLSRLREAAGTGTESSTGLSPWQTLGPWHYKSFEEDGCHTNSIESKDRLCAEWSPHPASPPVVSAMGRRAAGSAAACALHSGVSDASPEPNIQLRISESFKGEQKPLRVFTG